jgi:SAM-dependent methyltransferase
MQLEDIKNTWVNTQNNDMVASVEAWNSVAEDYIYKKMPTLYQDPFFKFLTDRVSLTKEMTSLDIGCGAGVYSIALAPYVKEVYGVDFSPNMITMANRLAEEEKSANATFLCENWYTYDISEWENQFDIVFAHMTPAIADFTTFEKMIRCAKKYCFMEKPCRRTDNVLDALRELLGLTVMPEKEDVVPYVFDALWAMGYSPEFGYRQEVWKSDKDIEDAEKWYLGRLKGATPLNAETEQKVKDYLKSIAVEGKIKEEIHTTIVSMFWHVK